MLSSASLHRLPAPTTPPQGARHGRDGGGAKDRGIETYSKGMRQRVKIAAALVHDPPVLLLDEPFNGMDPRQRLHLMDIVREIGAAGKTILFCSHILEEVERVAQHIEVLVAGRHAASGDFREIRRRMTDRPHLFRVRSSDDRTPGRRLIADPVPPGRSPWPRRAWRSQAVDFRRFTRLRPGSPGTRGSPSSEVSRPTKDLESVFSYLISGAADR